jgi:hypothetical protein
MDTISLARFTGLESLFMRFFEANAGLDLACLPASSMRQLAVSRWDVQSLAPLTNMTGLRQLDLKCFRDSLEPLSNMHDLKYVRVWEPAKAWALLRECTELEQAILIDIQMANMKRWNT